MRHKNNRDKAHVLLVGNSQDLLNKWTIPLPGLLIIISMICSNC